jgi:NADPH:quinone reductase-like Zn-dependent oxidoreductase/acyl transferase domain-containing protein
MMAVGLPEDVMQALLEREDVQKGPGHITVACINSPKNVTVSGAESKIDTLKEILNEQGVFARKLKVERAYHSPYMKDVSFNYWKSIQQIEAPKNTRHTSAMFSSVTGEKISFNELCSPDYWVSNMVSPVRFSNAIAAMCEGSPSKSKKLGNKKDQPGVDHLLEIGPAAALQTPIRDTLLIKLDKKNVKYFSMLQRGVSAMKTSLDTAGSLFCLGHPVKLESINGTSAESCDMLIDLPAYPFDHSKPYWGETRLSKNFRFRKYPRHDLLGAPIDDWDENDAQWRHFIRTTENMWVGEHRISGAILYPGAGMLVMAIEAAKQLAKPDKKVKGYRIREAAFLSPLVIPFDPVGVETHFHVRPMRDSAIGTSMNWLEFRLSSLESDIWKDKCRGLVTIEYEEGMTAVDSGKEAEEELKYIRERHAQGEKNCTIRVGARDLYEHLSAVGYTYGPTFQLLGNGRYSENYEAVANVNMPDLSQRMPKGHIHEHVIHPVTLDNVFQLSMMAGTKGGKRLGQVLVPTFVRDIFVSSKLTNREDAIRGYSESKLASFRDVESEIIASDPESLEPLVVVEGFRATALTALMMGNNPFAGSGKRKLAFSTDWKPDLALLDNEQASNLFNSPEKLSEILTVYGSDHQLEAQAEIPAAKKAEIPPEENSEASPSERPTIVPEAEIEDVEFICYAFMRKHLPKFTDEFVNTLKPHHKTYIAWMKERVERFDNGDVTDRRSVWKTLVQNEQYIDEVTERLKSSSSEGKLCTTIGPVLPELLSGQVDLDELLANDDLLRNVDDAELGVDIARGKLGAYIDVLAHKDSNLQVLELGAGRGTTTSAILQILRRQGTDQGAPRFAAYTFTDSTDTLFEEAKEKFKEYGQKVQFLPLNMDIDPAQQGFGLEKYDLIISANPLLSTSNINTYLQNVKKLLKPKGGKFCLLERCNPSALRSTFMFGLQPEWWRNADQYGKSGPIIQRADWAAMLENNQFTGIDINLPDFMDDNLHMTSAMIATTVQKEANRITTWPVPSFVLAASPASRFQEEIATKLKEKLEALGTKSCDIINLQEVPAIDLKKKCTVFLPEVEKAFLSDIDADNYAIIHKIVNTSFGVVWLTHGATLSVSHPELGMVAGLARSVRTENTPLSFLTVDFDKADDPTAVANIVLTVVKQAIHSPCKSELEYALRNGILYIHRIVEAVPVDDVIATTTGTMPPTLQKLGSFSQKPVRPMVLSTRTPGLIDTLHFMDNPFANTPLKDDEVEIEVRATGMNFLDLMTALGRIPGSLGVECSGTVFKAGEKSGFQVGDRVCGYVVLGFANYTRTKASLAKRIPESISYAEAASLPVIFATAYHAFYDVTRLRSGETVLIHWGAGGVGQAAIQIAQLIGAEIFTTVGSDEKKDFLMEKYGIRRERIFSSRDMTFARGVRRMTKGRGVDVILNAMAGDELRETWNCIAPYGRFVEISKRDIQVYGRLPMQPFSKHASFSSIDLEFMCQHCPDTLGDILEKVIKMVEERKIHPPQPLHKYNYGEIEDAIRFMQTGKHIGKIVIEARHEDMVKVSRFPPPSPKKKAYEPNFSPKY